MELIKKLLLILISLIPALGIGQQNYYMWHPSAIAIPTVNCGVDALYPGGMAYPTENTVVVGSNFGVITVTFEMSSAPDRLIMKYEGQFVYDTGYRGNTAYSYGGQYRSTFNSNLVGKTDPINGLVYPNATAWPEDGYPLVLSSSGSFSYNKTTPTPTVAIFMYSPAVGTLWRFTISCPQ